VEIGKIAKFFKLSRLERRLFWEAAFWCAVGRFAVFFFPFRLYARLLGHPQKELTQPPPPHQYMETTEKEPIESETINTPPAINDCLNRIAHAVKRASRHVPWQTRCLVEAIAAKQMLRHRHMNCTVYLGVAQENGQMIAHAWLESYHTILTGKLKERNFTVVAVFI